MEDVGCEMEMEMENQEGVNRLTGANLSHIVAS